MTKLNKYLIITFLFTYIVWGIIIAYTQISNISYSTSIFMLILYIIGVLAPMFTALILNKKMNSSDEFYQFLKNSFIPPKNYKWFIFIVIITAIFQLLPFSLLGGEKNGPLYLMVLQFPLFIIIGGLEEVGWRGLMQPEMEKRLSPFLSTLIIGIVWSLWHLPLFFIIGTYQYEFLNFFTFSLNTISFSFLLSVIYHHTKSVFKCIMTHALLNSISSVYVIKESLYAELWILALSLFIFYLASLGNINNQSRKI